MSVFISNDILICIFYNDNLMISMFGKRLFISVHHFFVGVSSTIFKSTGNIF